MRGFLHSAHCTFHVFFVFIVLAHHRRRVLHFNVTEQPTATWTAQQIVEAFPSDTAPRYLLRDRDGIYGDYFRRRVSGMGIYEVPIAARSPWQSRYVERLIGSIRRECLDHIIVLNKGRLRSAIASYLAYYHSARTHLSLNKDAPDGRAVPLPHSGKVVGLPHLGALHQEYVRLAARTALSTRRSLRRSRKHRGSRVRPGRHTLHAAAATGPVGAKPLSRRYLQWSR